MEFNPVLDMQNISKDKSILSSLEKKEFIVLSALVSKFNHVGKRQSRVIAITNKNIYNLLEDGIKNIFKSRIRRKIPISQIRGITVSRHGPQFVVHVQVQHDYRFSSPSFKLQIVQAICKSFCEFHKTKMPFYYTDDMVLINYVTTILDLKKGQRKINKVQPQLLDPESLNVIFYYQKNQNGKGTSSIIFNKKGNDKADFQEFKLIKVLGKGAFGKVMLCQKQDTKQLYAVKSLRKQNLIQKDQLQKTRTQRKLLQIANHPFLMSLQFAFQTKQKIFFVMNFLRGGQMYHHLKHFKRFEQKQSKFYAAQIVLALQYLHQNKYVFRDLKPQNILFQLDGYLQLTDYGMAKYLQNNQLTYSIVGTPDYMAPQILKSVGHNFSSDWWSLGILIYQMTHGFPPFFHRIQSKMFKSILEDEVTFRSNAQLSKDCKNIIKQLLCKIPNKRLGAEGAKSVKNHPWFAQISWNDLLLKKTAAPFIPTVKSEKDFDNFDETFTRQKPQDSVADSDLLLLKKYESQFQGMTYQPQLLKK